MTATPPGTAPLPELVVRNLGRIALAGLIIGGALLALIILQPGKIDPAAVAMVGTFLGVPTVCAGGLGAILASTRAPGDPPTPVTVTNPPADPVQTADVADDPPPAQNPAGPKKRTARRRTPRKG